tara:strand:- start:1163 stop:1726 length:564 start_codon:yes stop_codon:yes gene_type:complete
VTNTDEGSVTTFVPVIADADLRIDGTCIAKISRGTAMFAKLAYPTKISGERKTLRGCPSIPIKCWTRKSRFTAENPIKIRTPIDTAFGKTELVAERKLRRKSTADTAAAMLRTKWKCPTTKYVSWYAKSTDWFAKISPVNPPNTKQTTKPTKMVNSNDLNPISDRPKVQEKILIAVGIPIIAVADEK